MLTNSIPSCSFAFLLLLLSSSIAPAQAPVLQPSDFIPVIGEEFPGHTFDSTTAATFIPGPAGPNQTWNHSGVTTEKTDTVRIISPTSTPSTNDYSGSQQCHFHTVDGSYHFYKTDVNAMSLSGLLYTNGLDIPHSNPEDYIRFPMTYNDNYTDSLAATAVFQGVTYHRKGMVEVTADGYGSLVLPGGTYNDVLRVRYLENITDSSSVGIFVHVREIYVWILPGFHYPILSHITSTTNGQTDRNGSMYFPTPAQVSAAVQFEGEVEIFPNPASGTVRVCFSMEPSPNALLRVMDLQGRECHSVDLGRVPGGSHVRDLDLSLLPRGMYLMELRSAKRRVVKRLSLI